VSATPRGPVGVHVERGNQQRRIKVVGADGEVKAEVPHYAVVQALVEREGIATSLTPDALVEEELRAITVCEECREKPLSMRTRSIERRRHRSRPWLCRSCATRAAQSSMPTEQRRDSALRWQAAKTPEERAAAAHKRIAKTTPEQRREYARRASAAMTTERRREASRRGQQLRTPENRSETARRSAAKRIESMTPEQRSEVSRKGSATRMATTTPEQRSEATRKAWATRRTKQAANNNESTTGADQ
jgi:hypothetical protein